MYSPFPELHNLKVMWLYWFGSDQRRGLLLAYGQRNVLLAVFYCSTPKCWIKPWSKNRFFFFFLTECCVHVCVYVCVVCVAGALFVQVGDPERGKCGVCCSSSSWQQAVKSKFNTHLDHRKWLTAMSVYNVQKDGPPNTGQSDSCACPHTVEAACLSTADFRRRQVEDLTQISA